MGVGEEAGGGRGGEGERVTRSVDAGLELTMPSSLQSKLASVTSSLTASRTFLSCEGEHESIGKRDVSAQIPSTTPSPVPRTHKNSLLESSFEHGCCCCCCCGLSTRKGMLKSLLASTRWFVVWMED